MAGKFKISKWISNSYKIMLNNCTEKISKYKLIGPPINFYKSVTTYTGPVYFHNNDSKFIKFFNNLTKFWIVFVKFIYSEKARKFCEISTLLLSYVVRKVDISQNFLAFSEYINFTVGSR